jgi:hypothetical protein
MLQALVSMDLCAVTAVAQSGASSQPPPAPAQIAVPGAQAQAVSLTAVTPQYNFAYGQNPNQPLLPSGGSWKDFLPIQVNSSTPGFTTGVFGIQGVPDAFYGEPYFNSEGVKAGGCFWNQSYNSPPYSFYNDGSGYQLLSGPMLVDGAAIGSVYQSASQQVPGTGASVYGFGAIARWDPDTYSSPPDLIGTLNFNTSSCYAGDTEYGFAHYPYYNPPVNQFYFDTNSNCSAPTNQTGSYACYTTETMSAVAEQCQAAVNLPVLEANSEGNYWYFWYVFVSLEPTNGHYVFNAGLVDPFTHASAWRCTADPLAANTFSNCPNTGTVNYACASGQPFYPYPMSALYPGQGAVTLGIDNSDNIAPTGGVNPMMQTLQLYILETAP